MSKLRAKQIVEDTLEDKDGDTKVHVEKTSDDDTIRRQAELKDPHT